MYDPRDAPPAEIQSEIANALRDRALEPQVVVAFAQQNGSLVSVMGDVRPAGRFPVSPSGERVPDVIARAGEAVSSSFRWVTLSTLLYEQ